MRFSFSINGMLLMHKISVALHFNQLVWILWLASLLILISLFFFFWSRTKEKNLNDLKFNSSQVIILKKRV